MSLTKETAIDKIEILENGIVQVRQVTRIMENGEELSHSYERWVIEPGQDYSNQSDKIKSVCAVAHTPEVITAFESNTSLPNA